MARTDRPERPSPLRNDHLTACPRPSTRGAWSWTLAPLVLATSLALGTLSGWLVPPYLLLMAWVLFAPGRDRRRADDDPARPVPAVVALGDPIAGSPPAQPNQAEASPRALAEVKPPRGKGRGRKAKAAFDEPTAATWVRVGPGKFVRVEGPQTLPGPRGLAAIEPIEATAETPVPTDDPIVTRVDSPDRPSRPGEHEAETPVEGIIGDPNDPPERSVATVEVVGPEHHTADKDVDEDEGDSTASGEFAEAESWGAPDATKFGARPLAAWYRVGATIPRGQGPRTRTATRPPQGSRQRSRRGAGRARRSRSSLPRAPPRRGGPTDLCLLVRGQVDVWFWVRLDRRRRALRTFGERRSPR